MSTNHQVDQQKSRGKAILIVLIILLVLSIYLFLDVRIQKWGWPFKTVQEGDYAWLQWLFVSLTGTSLGLLKSGTVFYKRLFDEEEEAKKVDFIGFTPWYAMAIFRGPMIVLVVMFLLTNVTFSTALVADQAAGATAAETVSDEAAAPEEGAVAGDAGGEGNLAGTPLGLAIDLREAEPDVLILMTFLLGFYHRLPIHLLETIAKQVFPKAWEAAYAKETEDKGESGDESAGAEGAGKGTGKGAEDPDIPG